MKQLSFLLKLLFVIFAPLSCTADVTQTNNNFVVTEYKYKEKFVVDNDGNGIYAGIGIEWPVSCGKNSIENLQKTLLKFGIKGYDFYSKNRKPNSIDDFLNDYINIEEYQQTLEIPQKYSIAKGRKFDFETNINFEYITYCYIVTYILDQEKDNYVTYCSKTAYCTGPGHLTYNYIIYDFKNDCRLIYDDIFINGSTNKVKKIILNQLMKDYNVKSFSQLANKLCFHDDINEKKFYPSKNVGFVRNSFIFTYDPLEIACTGAGGTDYITVKVPAKELESVLSQRAKRLICKTANENNSFDKKTHTTHYHFSGYMTDNEGDHPIELDFDLKGKTLTNVIYKNSTLGGKIRMKCTNYIGDNDNIDSFTLAGKDGPKDFIMKLRSDVNDGGLYFGNARVGSKQLTVTLYLE